MIHIIITSYKEPKATVRAINVFLNQNIPEEFKITVVDPFPETEVYLKKHIKNKKVNFFLDPGEGKSYALNILFQENFTEDKNDLFILTDGDVYVSNNAVDEILKKFKDKKVGCVTGKPVSMDDRSTKYGYWSQVLFSGIDKVRKKLSDEGKFFECSGYLFAIRNNVLFDFPLDACEDAIIPYLFWKKGYKIAYADKAEVYVKNPHTWEDWLNQKIRNVKGHENLNKLAPDMPRTKTFWNEIKEGAIFTLKQPRNIKELFWNFDLYLARLYLYLRAFSELKKNKNYADGWRRNETLTTRTLD